MKKGFTLIELLVGVSILAILSVIGLSVFTSAQVKARDGVRKRDLKNIAVTLELYYTQNDQYVPGNGSCEQDAPAMYSSLTSFFPLGGVPKDPLTKNNYCYVSLNNGASYVLYARLENCADPEIVDPARCQLDMYNFRVFSQDLTPAQVASLAPIPTATPVPTSAPTSVPTTVPTTVPTATPVTIAGDLSADIVLGQPDFYQASPGEITNFKLANPGGVVVDRTANPDRVYVFDGLNSRILGYRSLGVCQNDSARVCTSDSDCVSSTCQVQVAGISGSKKADIVIGQPDFTHSACNNDGTYHSYPSRAPTSASMLCSLTQYAESPFEDGSWAQMEVDAQGSLYVPDFENNRVLKYISPFDTDTVADEVWGQPDLTSNGCNITGDFGQFPPPTASSFCFHTESPYKPAMAGVDIDSNGNMWVSDPKNNRVLRFTKNSQTGVISKTADLVLGQTDFTSSGFGSTLNKFYTPTGIRVNSQGKVYVADTDNHRILMFDNPTTNGASGVLFGSSLTLLKPTGLELDVQTADPASGGIWLHDTGNNRLVLFDFNGTPKKVLNKDTFTRSGTCGPNAPVCRNSTGNMSTGLCNFCDTRGSIGITSDGDILFGAATNFQNVNYYKHPIPTPIPDITYGPDYQLFSPPDYQNYLSNKGMRSPRGVTVSSNQLIVADSQRIMFWSIPNGVIDLTNGKPADGVVGVPNFTTFAADHFSKITSDSSNLWVIHKYKIERYVLPLSTGQMPTEIIQTRNFKYLGQSSAIGRDLDINGIYADSTGKYLWVALPFNRRVLRVRIPVSGVDYFVDAVIGASSTIPPDDYTFYPSCPDPNDLCAPGAVTEDKNGHLFVSDYYLENRGTGRLIRFDKSLLPQNNASLIVLGVNQAAQNIPSVFGWQPTFDSLNNLSIGGAAFTGRSHWVYYYSDIVASNASSLPSTPKFNDHYTQGFASDFDSQDNLYITDMNRGRVLIYKSPAGALPSPTPVATPPVFPKMGNLIAYWKMDEASWNGTAGEVRDSSANGNHGTAVGAVITASKAGLGNAASMNGTSSYINVPDSAGLDLSGAFTISAWVNPLNPGAESEIVQKGTASDCQNYGLLLPGSRQLTALSSNACSWSYAATNASVALNQWQHIAVTYNGTNITYYVNGNGPAQKDSKAWGSIGAVNSGSLVIGGGPAQQAQDFFGGKIDEVGIWNAALTDAEIADLYNGGSGLPLSLNNQNQAVAGISTAILPGFIQNLLQNIELVREILDISVNIL